MLFFSVAVNLLSAATDSIYKLFDNPNDPKRLATPSGGVSIDDAISNADANLDQLILTNGNSGQAQQLTQLLGLAKGLQMLQPYFTDLTMNQVSSSGQTSADLAITNSSINALGITDANDKKILNDLMAFFGNAATQSIVFLYDKHIE